ncbi:MAG: hypothetical protein MUC92_06845 [Fimbriimonadaceae bacterium]|nr:hypothetical protein [Fimbriimonadaceae bacterium]
MKERLGPRLRRRIDGGFTLLETVIGLFVTLMGVLTFASLMLLSNKIALQNKLRAIGYQIAREKVETFQDVSFEALAIGTGDLPIPETLLDQLPTNSKLKYQILADYSITQMPDPLLKKIVVRVRWMNAMSGTGTPTANSEIRLVRILAMPAPNGQEPTPVIQTSIVINTLTLAPDLSSASASARNTAGLPLGDTSSPSDPPTTPPISTPPTEPMTPPTTVTPPMRPTHDDDNDGDDEG